MFESIFKQPDRAHSRTLTFVSCAKMSKGKISTGQCHLTEENFRQKAQTTRTHKSSERAYQLKRN
jgi:hypothetical protein